MFAIIRTGGKQYRVRQGDEIVVERLDAPEGSDVTIEDVLLVDRDGAIQVGAPTVPGASVAATVNAHMQSDKVLVFKYKNKTRRRQMHGHRQQQTRLKINSITAG